jgi:hypothetical protein
MLPRGRFIGFTVTAVASLLLLILPAYGSGRALIDVNGPRAFVALVVPVMIALVLLIVPRLKIVAACLVLTFALITGFSIGLFYLPAAIVLLWPERR